MAAVLAAGNAYIQGRDRAMALGPASPAQKAFYIQLVDRPDVASFFKRFSPAEKLKIAKNLRQYPDPEIIELAEAWLNDFDAPVRKELQSLLVEFAPQFPETMAKQLKNSGGFQKVGTFAALESQKSQSLPFVIEQLEVPEARSNAVEYLVGLGNEVGPRVLAKLNSKEKDTQLAAADALGRMGFAAAANRLLELYRNAEGADRSTLLASLANLGSSESEITFKELLVNPRTPASDRSSAILGLGRIGSPTAISFLWRNIEKDPADKDEMIQALRLAGPAALRSGERPINLLQVATGITGPVADQTIRKALEIPEAQLLATQFSESRSGLVDALVAQLRQLNPNQDGKLIERTVASLASTPSGKKALLNFRSGPLSGFVERQLLK
ncbi:MAG TPA: HEAT repeat domain-containing protein [Fimbriimonadaceae bacterium]|nr:HEAT repeat domain-containing protein [Fimbriimonadaceae bacterium]